MSILLVYDTFVLSAKARLLYFFFFNYRTVSVFLQITANRNKLFLTTIYCSILPNKAGCELLFHSEQGGGGGLHLLLLSQLIQMQFRGSFIGGSANKRRFVGKLLWMPEPIVTWCWVLMGAVCWVCVGKRLSQGGGGGTSLCPSQPLLSLRGPVPLASDRKWSPAGCRGQFPSLRCTAK